MPSHPPSPVLLVRAGRRICALSLAQVVETMRPLPTVALPGMPSFVRGAAVVRGSAVPVVHLDAFLGSSAVAEPTRFVVVRSGERTFALAVDAVVGVHAVDGSARAAPLLEGGGAVEALGALDHELLVVLQAARVVPDGAWRALADAGVGG